MARPKRTPVTQPDAGAKANRAFTQVNSVPIPKTPPQLFGSHTPSEHPPQAGPKRSRLPSQSIARKKPCKAGPRTAPVKSLKESKPPKLSTIQSPFDKQCDSKGGKPYRPRQGSKQYSCQIDHLAPNSALRSEQKPIKKREETSVLRARNRPIILDEDECDDEAKMDSAIASVEISGSGKDVELSSSSSKSLAVPWAQRHQGGETPRHAYTIPNDLEGVERALGKDNWNEYMVSMEKMCLGEITREEHARQSNRIFTVFDDITKRRMEKKVMEKIVKPVLGGLMREKMLE